MIRFYRDQNQCKGDDKISKCELAEPWFFTLARLNTGWSNAVGLHRVLIRQHFGFHLSVWQGHVIWPALFLGVCLRPPSPPLCCVSQFVQLQRNVVVLSWSHQPCPQVRTHGLPDTLSHRFCQRSARRDDQHTSVLNLDTASCGLDEDSLRGLQGENRLHEV